MANPVRVQLSRKKGWKMPENTVKVSRPSLWGNPFKVGEQSVDFDGELYKLRADDCVRMFRQKLRRQLANQPEAFEAYIAPLRGKNLACWCRLDQPCHADVLLELANKGDANG